MHKRSEELFERASSILVGGVNSPVRAFRGVGGSPVFMSRGGGSHVEDEDGNSYVDYVLSWGPLILGHAHPAVVDAVIGAVRAGSSFGAPTLREIELAEMVRSYYPSLEKLRFVSSGTEACMGAVRAARGFTGRDKIIKFEGCYHGHADYLLAKAGSGATTLGRPDSRGVPASFTEHTIIVPYNDVKAVERAFAEHGPDLAAVIVEPVAGNMGLILPEPGFLDSLRNLCTHFDSVLIFDEVLVGFRIKDGAQGHYKVRPDLTCLGKVIGGGFPVGCYGGKKEIMSRVAPEGPVYQAGTLSGNPVAMAAGLATLEELGKEGVFGDLENRTRSLVAALRKEAESLGESVSIVSVGSLFCVFFADKAPINYGEATGTDSQRYGRFFHSMLKRGIYLAPSAFESAFMSTAHSYKDIDKTARAFRESLQESAGGK